MTRFEVTNHTAGRRVFEGAPTPHPSPMRPDTPLRTLGERQILRRLRGRIPAGEGVIVGIGDDAAALTGASTILATTDSMVEGVHFRREWSPARLVGRKALSRNLSDIGAMGGLPRYALVSLCLPEDTSAGWFDGFYDGLLERAAEAGVSVVGGNLSSSPGAMVVDLTLLGETSRPLVRSGGRAGDHLVVTGALGASATGLRLLAEGARLDENGDLLSLGAWAPTLVDAVTRCLRAHLDPRPPLSFGRAVGAEGVASAGIDLSDGLSSDLLALCEASDLTARVVKRSVPVDAACAAISLAEGRDPMDLALHGGEDYELLLAVADEAWPGVQSLAGVFGLSLVDIGRLEAGPPNVVLETDDGDVLLEQRAHEHFRGIPGGQG